MILTAAHVLYDHDTEAINQDNYIKVLDNLKFIPWFAINKYSLDELANLNNDADILKF